VANNPSASAPLFELFTSLGLDTSPLISGLENVQVDLRAFQSKMNDWAVSVGRAFEKGSNETIAFIAAQKQSTAVMGSEADAAEYLSETLNDLISAQQRLNEQKRLEAESYLATIDMSNRMAAAVQAEAASRAEYARLVQYYKDEELAAYHEKLDEYEELNEEQTRSDIENLKARDAAWREYLAKWEAYGRSAAGGAAGGGGGFAGGSGGITVGSGGVSPYFRLRETVAPLMQLAGPLFELLIPVALISLGIDLMERYGKSIGNVVDRLLGIVEVNKMLDDSMKKQLSTMEMAADRMTAIDRIAKKEGRTPGQVFGEISHVNTPATKLMDAQATAIRAQLSGLDQAIAIAEANKMPGEFFRNQSLRMAATARNVTGGDQLTLDTAKKRQETLRDDLERVEKKKFDLQMEEVRIMDQHTKSLKRMHDVVHEFSERLPNAKGPNPADIMLQTLGFGPQPVQVIHGGGNVVTTSQASRLAPRVYGGDVPGQSTQPQTGGAARGTANVGGISVSFTFNYKFDGIPADVQSFVRDKMEPKLIEDINGNVRGVAEKIITALKNKGVRVNG